DRVGRRAAARCRCYRRDGRRRRVPRRALGGETATLHGVPQRYDAVLLDLYDTIVWSEWFRMRDAIAARIGDGMEADRLQKAFEQTRPARGVGEFGSVEGDMAAVLEAAGVPYDATLVDELVELERAHLERGIHLYDDVLPALASLGDRGVPTALVSNCSHSTRPVVERLGLEEVFD